MFARSHGPRAVLTSLGALLPVAACLASGCGSSGSSNTTSAEGGFTSVVTSGGGVQNADAGVTDPFAGSSSSSSSGGGSGSSSGPDGGASSSGGGDASASSSSGGDDASSSGSDAPSEGSSGGTPYTPPTCDGVNPCDLRSNTCCLATTASGLVGTCMPGTTMNCSQTPTPQATVHCLQALECGAGLSCCGDIIQLLGQVRSSCVNVAAGGNCPYVPATIAQAGVQLCKTDAECKNGQPCVHQTCIYGAVLDICGLQSGAPLNCH